jgi:ribosomal protein S27E
MSLSKVNAKRTGKKSETVACDLCGSKNYNVIFTARNTEFGEPFNLVKCQVCGLAYLNPRPTKAQIGRYYPEENYYAYQDLDSQSWNNLRQRIKNLSWNLSWVIGKIWVS